MLERIGDAVSVETENFFRRVIGYEFGGVVSVAESFCCSYAEVLGGNVG